MRIRATCHEPGGVFVGIGESTDVGRYLGAVERERLVDLCDRGRPGQLVAVSVQRRVVR